MRRLLARLGREEKGSAATMVAVSMTAIVGLAALGTDVGRLYVERQRLSAVADAAALSGAQHLPVTRDSALSAVYTYLEKNGIDRLAAEVSISDDNREVSVNINNNVAMTFARVIGPDSVPVAGGAVARTSNLSGSAGVVPLGVVRDDWVLGEQVTLKNSPGNGGLLSPGNFGALALGGNGASRYENNIRYGYADMIRVGDWLTTEPGDMSGPTERAIEHRIDQDPHVTFENVRKNSPRVVIVPMLDRFTTNGRGEVQVIGFAAFFLESVDGHGNNRGAVTGRFLRYIVEGESNGSGGDFGLLTIKLIH